MSKCQNTYRILVFSKMLLKGVKERETEGGKECEEAGTEGGTEGRRKGGNNGGTNGLHTSSVAILAQRVRLQGQRWGDNARFHGRHG